MSKKLRKQPDNDLLDELVDVYTTMSEHYIDSCPIEGESIIIRCTNNKVYRIRLDFVTRTPEGVPWNH